MLTCCVKCVSCWSLRPLNVCFELLSWLHLFFLSSALCLLDRSNIFWTGLCQLDCRFELMEEFFSTLAPHFHQAASAILFSEQRAVLFQSRTLACLLFHRPNAYYDWSNGPLFASEWGLSVLIWPKTRDLLKVSYTQKCAHAPKYEWKLLNKYPKSSCYTALVSTCRSLHVWICGPFGEYFNWKKASYQT